MDRETFSEFGHAVILIVVLSVVLVTLRPGGWITTELAKLVRASEPRIIESDVRIEEVEYGNNVAFSAIVTNP